MQNGLIRKSYKNLVYQNNNLFLKVTMLRKVFQIRCQTSELCHLQMEKSISNQIVVTNKIKLPHEITVKIYIVSIQLTQGLLESKILVVLG